MKHLLSVTTYSLEMARAIHPPAGPDDVGDLKLYWDPANADEVAAAKQAFEAASAMGIRFFRLDGLEGTLITSWDMVEAPAAESPDEPAADQPAPRRRGRPPGRRSAADAPSTRVQGVAPIRGGRRA